MLSDLLKISQNKQEIISLVGAGGKTSILLALAEELKQKRYRVLVTTTTKIFHPEQQQYDCIYFQPTVEQVKPKPGSITVIGSKLLKRENKIAGLDFKMINRFSKYFDAILIEADGSRQKNIKFPNDNEPIIHPKSTIVAGIVGLNCLGNQINQSTVHRASLFIKAFGYSENQIVDIDKIIQLINHPRGLFKNTPEKSRKICILNQLDQLAKITKIKNKFHSNQKIIPNIDELYFSGIIDQKRYWCKVTNSGE